MAQKRMEVDIQRVTALFLKGKSQLPKVNET